MKTRFNNRELAHVWASRSQECGYGSNLFFEGDSIYSYGKHFPIARFYTTEKGRVIVLFNRRRYSITTTRHQSYVRAAISHYHREGRIAYCNSPERDPEYELEIRKQEYFSCLRSYQTHDGDKRKQKKDVSELASEVRAVEDFCDVTELDVPEWCVVPEDIKTLAAELFAEEERQAKEAARRKAEREKKELKDAHKRLLLWEKGETVSYVGFHKLPVKLRILDETIQTSHGAIILISGLMTETGSCWLWDDVNAARKSILNFSGLSAKLPTLYGYYTLTEIQPDGSIKVGCHHIKYKELKKIAIQLGLDVE